MAAKDAVVTLDTSGWTQISDGDITEALLLQNQGSQDAIIAFAAAASPPGANTPGIRWPAGAAEPNFTIPGGPLSVFGRAAAGAIGFYVKHA